MFNKINKILNKNDVFIDRMISDYSIKLFE